jgi:hypothetical protein
MPDQTHHFSNSGKTLPNFGQQILEKNDERKKHMKTKTNIIYPAFTIFAFACFILSPLAGARDGVLNLSDRDLLRPEPTFTTFDVPDARSTVPFAINPAGLITGVWVDDVNRARHGFLRDSNGTISTFDAPGAGTDQFQGTRSVSINPSGTVTGYYLDASDVYHGHLRTPDGTITTFDVPGAGTGPNQGTLGFSINSAGVIAGWYVDGNQTGHGFVRASDGTITTYDVPGAGTGASQGTFVFYNDCINPAGVIAGYYIDGNNTLHGYLRTADGTITNFDAPGAGTDPNQGTQPAGINQAGTNQGVTTDSNGAFHGYVHGVPPRRDIFFIIDVPGAGTGSNQGTVPQCINTRGKITGVYIDAGDVNHGFERHRSGAITTFDVPGAGTAPGQGTVPSGNNSLGAITGYYADENFVTHGFLRTPDWRP